MNGRLESELLLSEKTEEKLNELPDYVSEWYYYLKASNKSAQTRRDFVNKIRRFLSFVNPSIKTIKLEDINFGTVTKYVISIQTKEDSDGNTLRTSDSYKQGVWFALNNFFTYLKKRNYIAENYMELIDNVKNNDLQRINENRKLLTAEDFEKIILAAKCGTGSGRARAFQERTKDRDVAILTLLMVTGMRESALCQINVNDIDFEKKKLYVIDKGDKKHEYCLPDNVLDTINNWLDKREDYNTEALFVTPQKKRISQRCVDEMVRKYSKAALGYEISPHKLRSGFCSIMYNQTKDAEFVRRAVGHSNLNTTKRYIVTDNREKEKAAACIAAYVC